MSHEDNGENSSAISTRELANQVPAEDANYSELQRWMAQLIAHPRSLKSDAHLKAAAALHFQSSPRLTAAQQIDIYRKQFWLRHTQSLIEDFPALTTYLGQSRWESLAESFLTELPPKNRFLGKVGEELPSFIKRNLKEADAKLCHDLATLEWSYCQIFDARDLQNSKLQPLSQLSDEEFLNLKFSLNPALIILELNFPVDEFRRQLIKQRKHNLKPPSPPGAEKQFLAIYRFNGSLSDTVISQPCALLLESLARGLPLGDACQEVVDSNAAFESVLAAEMAAYFELFSRLRWLEHSTIAPFDEVSPI